MSWWLWNFLRKENSNKFLCTSRKYLKYKLLSTILAYYMWHCTSSRQSRSSTNSLEKIFSNYLPYTSISLGRCWKSLILPSTQGWPACSRPSIWDKPMKNSHQRAILILKTQYSTVNSLLTTTLLIQRK